MEVNRQFDTHQLSHANCMKLRLADVRNAAIEWEVEAETMDAAQLIEAADFENAKARTCAEHASRMRNEGSPIEAFRYDLYEIEYRRNSRIIARLVSDRSEINDKWCISTAEDEVTKDEAAYKLMTSLVAKKKNIEWFDNPTGLASRSSRTGAHPRGELLQGLVEESGVRAYGKPMWHASIMDATGRTDLFPTLDAPNLFFSKEDAQAWVGARI